MSSIEDGVGSATCEWYDDDNGGGSSYDASDAVNMFICHNLR